jgi:hypothetical protein
LLSTPTDQVPKSWIRLQEDGVPIVALHTDEHCRRSAVPRYDYPILLGIFQALPDLFLKVSNANGFHRICLVILPRGLRRIARMITTFSSSETS